MVPPAWVEGVCAESVSVVQILSVDELGEGIKPIRPQSLVDMMKVGMCQLSSLPGHLADPVVSRLSSNPAEEVRMMRSHDPGATRGECEEHVRNSVMLWQWMHMSPQATAGMEDDEEFEGMNGRPGNTIGQPSIMNGLNRHMVHTTSTISNAPNVPVGPWPQPHAHWFIALEK